MPVTLSKRRRRVRILSALVPTLPAFLFALAELVLLVRGAHTTWRPESLAPGRLTVIRRHRTVIEAKVTVEVGNRTFEAALHDLLPTDRVVDGRAVTARRTGPKRASTLELYVEQSVVEIVRSVQFLTIFPLLLGGVAVKVGTWLDATLAAGRGAARSIGRAAIGVAIALGWPAVALLLFVSPLNGKVIPFPVLGFMWIMSLPVGGWAIGRFVRRPSAAVTPEADEPSLVPARAEAAGPGRVKTSVPPQLFAMLMVDVALWLTWDVWVAAACNADWSTPLITDVAAALAGLALVATHGVFWRIVHRSDWLEAAAPPAPA